ncbi:hypothetical protein JW979_15965 [bacterium]|nr:hypothetical protein [candidate division CSSED10-310 bacterium]
MKHQGKINRKPWLLIAGFSILVFVFTLLYSQLFQSLHLEHNSIADSGSRIQTIYFSTGSAQPLQSQR